MLAFVGQTQPRHPEVDPALVGEIRQAEAGASPAPVFVERTLTIERYHRAADVRADRAP